MKFIGYNPVVKYLRADKSWRVEFDVSSDEFDNIKDLPKLQDTTLEIIVKQQDG